MPIKSIGPGRKGTGWGMNLLYGIVCTLLPMLHPTVANATIGKDSPHDLTLTIVNDTTVTHTLMGTTGLYDGVMDQDTVLATGTFSGSAHTYGFKWENRDANCGPDLGCSRVKSQENANDYIDMVAVFTPPATLEADDLELGYKIVNLGTGTSGTYTLRHMTGVSVKAGTYRVQTVIGVYTP